MAKLYPPYIEEKIPAQSGTVLKIPFRLNRAVSINQVDCVIARIKTVSTSTWKGTLPDLNEGYTNFTFDSKTQNYYVEIPNETLGLNIGQYYKVQLAFYNKESGLGYYSSVGVFKYSAIPELYIEDLDKTNRNANKYSYIGVYNQQNGDITEKEYSYCFTLTDEKTGNLIASSGTKLHNSSEDDSNYESRDEFIVDEELVEGSLYILTYTVTTMNNMEIEVSYYIQRTDIYFEPIEGTIAAENDYDNGCVNIWVQTEKDKEKNSGYIISRADSSNNYSTWVDLFKFTVGAYADFPSEPFKDYTTEQGIYYKYAIQQYQTSGLRTKRLEIETPLLSDFEDIFLFDKYRQLKVRFNPKVTSFKNTLLETKLDTLGGQYPFIFRNGTTEYKEFPISGLISYLSDNDELFMSNAELGFEEQNAYRIATGSGDFKLRVRSTQIDSENFFAERNFKLSVLDWLTNGETKLFRSPAEGNYIVRLMNVSLTPNDTVSRMLHTFNCTAYEIAEYNRSNLVKYGFLEEKNDSAINENMTFSSIELDSSMNGTKLLFQDKGGLSWCVLRGLPSGAHVKLNFMDGKGDVDIVIGYSGTYKVNIYDYLLYSIEFVDAPGLTGYIDYGYLTSVEVDDFSPIRNIIFSVEWGESYGENYSVIDDLEDIKLEIDTVDYLGLHKKDMQDIWENGDKELYFIKAQEDNCWQEDFDNGKYIKTDQSIDGHDIYVYSPEGNYSLVYSKDTEKYNPKVIYKVKRDYSVLTDVSGPELVTESGHKVIIFAEDAVDAGYYADGRNVDILYPSIGYEAEIQVEGESAKIYSVDKQGEIKWTELPRVEYIGLENGVWVDYNYQQIEYVYSAEEENTEVATLKRAWLDEKEKLNKMKSDASTSAAAITKQESAVWRARYNFIKALKEAIL